jgi:hypothetical protein
VRQLNWHQVPFTSSLFPTAVHRWVLHYPLFVPKSLSDWLGKDFFYMVHGHHHVHPDRPPYFPLPHSQVMAFVSYGMFRLLLPAPWACGIGAGGMGGLLRGISFFFFLFR